MMKIAWIGKKSPRCGNVIYGSEIVKGLVDRNWQAIFAHFVNQAEAKNHLLSIKSEVVPEIILPSLYKSAYYTIPAFNSYKILLDNVRKFQPDIVHASIVLSPIDYLLPKMCADLKKPLFTTFHQPFDYKYRSLTSQSQLFIYLTYAPFLAHYDRIIIFSEIQKTILTQIGVPSDRIAVIPNGVNPDKYAPGPSQIKAELQAQRLFLYQGRLTTEKNVETLLQVWHQSKMPDGYKLAIVGTGPIEFRLKSLYGNDPSIIFLGYIGEEQRRIEILRGTDVFILPSLVEGLSIALLEAMACGVACIATDVGADGEVLADGAGIILDAGNIALELSEAFQLLIDQPELIDILGEQARQRVLERYHLSKNLDRLEELYLQTLSCRS